ncbi:hypothetical protein [Paraliomyxa miuraensis]|uniref:hypothetical protein n=1 Tax=Paraliomyxa miuraensis TaxID=376150 RepID=UPI0022563DCC|nr:hypothetical protein [Paraliomyxa miuraensis]MCX4245855.1 hypothetical protein [Paraliomyxa miuraensis]
MRPSSLGVPLLLAGLVAATSLVHDRVDERRAALPPGHEVAVLPTPRTLEVMSLGYREAIADLVWVRALVFAGENLGHTDTVMVERYVWAISALAPRFHRPYLWGGITAIYGGAGKIDRTMVQSASRIYRAGLRRFPESHELLYAHGMLLTHQVGSTPGFSPAEKEALQAEGIELIRKAAAHGADPLVRRYAATLITEHATDQLAIQFLESQLVEAEDEAHRRLLRLKLGGLVGREGVERLERLREAFVAEQQRVAPYVPDSLYAVIRAEASPLSPAPGSSNDFGSGD